MSVKPRLHNNLQTKGDCGKHFTSQKNYHTNFDRSEDPGERILRRSRPINHKNNYFKIGKKNSEYG